MKNHATLAKKVGNITVMPQGTLKIHSENILPIIKKSLYSDKEIFVRELVSNSSDALTKLSLLNNKGLASIDPSTFRIDIEINEELKTLSIKDNGLGMTPQEVENYIAQIAFSGAEEFVKNYETENEKDRMIGHFGLGFYSAFMVSSKVEVITQSYKEEEPTCHFSSDGSTTYDLDIIEKKERGTEIILHIDEESLDFLEEGKLTQVVKKYCSFLPYPIYVKEKRINEKEPLFLKNAADCTEEEYLQFFHDLYPFEQDPIFWVHLNIDYPFNLKGILYFPKINERVDFRKSTVKLFCNRVFVSDDVKELLPDYLTLLKGAIDSPDIPLNVSRSYLHMDKTVRQLGSHLSKKVTDRLLLLLETDKERYIKAYQDLDLFLKLGALQDEKFYERGQGLILFQTLQKEWVSIQDYLNLYKEKTNGKIYYTIDSDESYFANLYQSQGIGVLKSTSQIDNHLFQMIESKNEGVKIQRIDGGIDDLIVNKEETEAKEELLAFAKEKLSPLKVDVELKPLQTKDLPAFVLIDEEARRLRDYMRLQKQDHSLDLFDKKTLVLNTTSPLILKIEELQSSNKELAETLLLELYDIALLSQRELSSEHLPTFLKRSTDLLEKLVLSL